MQRVGINQKADFLEKATWVLIGLLLFLTLLSSIFLKDAPQSNRSPNLVKAQKDQALKTTAVPNAMDDAATKEDQEPPSNATNAASEN